MAVTEDPAQRPAAVAGTAQAEPPAQEFIGFDAPDTPVDPRTETAANLARFGLPPKPDAARQPAWHAAWEHAFGQPIQLLPFQRDAVVVTGGHRIERRVRVQRFARATRIEASSNWSGAYVTSNGGNRFVALTGSWHVPKKLAPPSSGGAAGLDSVVATWIGLDGQRLYLDSTLPQIGTSATLDKAAALSATAWIQWWARNTPSATPVTLTNLAVAPGDEIAAFLTVVDPTTVIAVLVNLSSSPAHAVSVKATAPLVRVGTATVTPVVAGATAEWIVERPQVVGETTQYNLPDFGQMEFRFCAAIAAGGGDPFLHGHPQDLTAARGIRMYDVLPAPPRTAFISMPHDVSGGGFGVRYGGFPR